MRLFFLIVGMFIPTIAYASYHSAPATPISGIGLIMYNVEHFVLHIVYTAQTIFEVGPLAAMMMLDGICFSAAPPMTHLFFATGFSAVVTTLLLLLLTGLMVFRLFLALWRRQLLGYRRPFAL